LANEIPAGDWKIDNIFSNNKILIDAETLENTAKKGYRFPVPSPGVTKQIVPARESLVSDIPSGDGKNP
jgi:hypothetical protein